MWDLNFSDLNFSDLNILDLNFSDLNILDLKLYHPIGHQMCSSLKFISEASHLNIFYLAHNHVKGTLSWR